MTVHMFRVYIGRGKMSIPDLETRIDDWVQSNAEWVEDSTEHVLTERNTALDGSGATFHSIDVRFEKSNAKSNLFQKFEDKLVNKVGWYRVGYHECNHDDGAGGGCSFDAAEDPNAEAREWTAKDVTIDSNIPDFPTGAYQ